MTSFAHDVGGEDWGAIDPTDKKYALWERQIHALISLLVRKNIITVTELRRGIEGLLPEAYANLTYYEKWAASALNICVERGVLTLDEIEKELGELQDDPEVRFKAGDIVRVKPEDLATRWRRPHLRTPGYIFGVTGTIVQHSGTFHNPEKVAFRQQGPKQPLYIVRFRQKDLWELYDGGPGDTVDADIYQHWLEPASPASLEHRHHEHEHEHGHEHEHEHGHAHGHAHGHEHGHAHGHGVIDHGDHTHDARTMTEQKAIDLEGDASDKKKLSEAFIKILIAKEKLSAEELRAGIEMVDSLGQKGEGSRIVARAWVDPVFKGRLLADAGEALPEIGFPKLPPTADNPNATKLIVVENTPKVHNVVVCTLCSCYPMFLLGLPPPWYKDRSYRGRVVRDPRGTLKAFGLELPLDVAIQVHDSTADLRYLVIPQRPEGTEGWSEEQLQKLVNRDSMIGVSVARSPQQV